MRRFLKLWTICLISLALPIQAAAAVSMLNCGANHHQHTHSQEALHHHHSHTVQDTATDAEHDALASTGVSKAKCSACSSCCAAVALPGMVVSFEGTPVPDCFLPFAGSSPASFFSSGPERPPRLFLA